MDKLIDSVDPDKILYEHIRFIIRDYIFTTIPKRECEIFKDSETYQTYKKYEECIDGYYSDEEDSENLEDSSSSGNPEYFRTSSPTLYGYYKTGRFKRHQPTYNTIVLEITQGYGHDYSFLGSVNSFLGSVNDFFKSG